jgi:ABC-type phosphate transport system ATPase subunit
MDQGSIPWPRKSLEQNSVHGCGEALEKYLKVLDFIRVQCGDVNIKTILQLTPSQRSDSFNIEKIRAEVGMVFQGHNPSQIFH